MSKAYVKMLLNPRFWLHLAYFYFYNWAVALNQTLLSVPFGGSPDVTFCGRMGALAEDYGVTWPAKILDKIFGRGHCQKAIERNPGDKSAWGKAVDKYHDRSSVSRVQTMGKAYLRAALRQGKDEREHEKC